MREQARTFLILFALERLGIVIANLALSRLIRRLQYLVAKGMCFVNNVPEPSRGTEN